MLTTIPPKPISPPKAPIGTAYRNDNRNRRCAKALSLSSATDEGDFLIKGSPQFFRFSLIHQLSYHSIALFMGVEPLR